MAMVGAIPSSFVFFGTYEAVKTRLTGAVTHWGPRTRAEIHCAAAACGNAAASLIFVPKEMIKQRLQAARVAGDTATVRGIVAAIVRREGVRGLYAAYTATLMRNIPSTAVRFLVYEELKHQLARLHISDDGSVLGKEVSAVCGFVSGAVASVTMTPIDVAKTRLALGIYPSSLGLRGSLARIARDEGLGGLFAGAKARMVGSAIFSSVGMWSYEAAKEALGCAAPSRPLPDG